MRSCAAQTITQGSADAGDSPARRPPSQEHAPPALPPILEGTRLHKRLSAFAKAAEEGGDSGRGSDGSEQGAPGSPVRLRYGAAAGQGARQAMEDAHVIWPAFAEGADPEGAGPEAAAPQSAFFGLFDGHNGTAAAEYGREHLAKALLASEHFPHDLTAALRHAYLRTDEGFYREVQAAASASTDSGSTALSAVLWDRRLVIANAGDCRAVLSRRGKALDLTRDHKPSCDIERERIQAAGGYVSEDGRLGGHLSVARAMGDYGARDHPDRPGRLWLKRPSDEPGPFRFVGPLTAEPEVTEHELQPEDEFVVLACDGLWDVLSSQRCVELARQHLRTHNDPAQTAQFLVDTSFEKHASDNVTCLVVCFSERAPPPRFTSLRTVSRNGLASLATALSDADLLGPGPLGAGPLRPAASLLHPPPPLVPTLAKVASEDLREGK